MLDAPDLVDDYYLNLLSWGSQDVLAVALGRDVYLWNGRDGTAAPLGGGPAPHGDYVSSVAWAEDGRHLAVGVAGSGEVQVWDAVAGRRLRSLKGHAARVGALAWSGATLSTGGRDSVVLNHDVR